MKKINLEEILDRHLSLMIKENPEKFNGLDIMKRYKEYATMINAMHEACNQTIELIVENADSLILGTHIDGTAIINRSKLRTLKNEIG